MEPCHNEEGTPTTATALVVINTPDDTEVVDAIPGVMLNIVEEIELDKTDKDLQVLLENIKLPPMLSSLANSHVHLWEDLSLSDIADTTEENLEVLKRTSEQSPNDPGRAR